VTSNEQEPIGSIELNVVLQKTLENCKAAIEESQASVTSDHLPTVRGHDAHFVQLFQNLIGNALKYRGERPPRIHVSAVEENGLCCAQVATLMSHTRRIVRFGCNG
jgi:light-regulated signal transduction histidine kinase (bacteriophytochrome)